MIDEIRFFELLGPSRFFIWSKENEIKRTFYRTEIAGHWKKKDVEEFNQCGCFYEIHLDHKYDSDAHMFCLQVLQRCDNFKAAMVSKLAVNNMKVIILLGRSGEFRDQIAYLAEDCDFELSRLRSKSDRQSDVERFAKTKLGEYAESLRGMFAPMAGFRVPRRH
jgi:hypothetical protein